MDAGRRAGIDARLKAEAARHRPGYALPAAFYTDPEIYELELERVVWRNWILAGHVSEFREAGDFKTLAVARESALIVRGEDGELRAFANVCRHRGSRVCLERAGRTRRFVCPYHGWVYALDGSLTAARDMPAGFESNEYPLTAIPVEQVHGLVFVAFHSLPPPLSSARRELERPLRWFGFESLKLAASRSYAIPANWKLAIENYQECYHCAAAHPEYASRHTLMLGKSKRKRVQQSMLDKLDAAGLEPLTIDRIDTAAPPGETGYGYSRTALFDGYLTGSRDGQPLAPLLGELRGFDGGASDFSFGGFNFLLAYSDHVVGYVFTPVEHDSCSLTVYWYVRGDAEEGRDYDPAELTWLWHNTTLEDLKIIENNWQGVRSRHYRPGPLSKMETAQRNWLDWLLAELLEPARA